MLWNDKQLIKNRRLPARLLYQREKILSQPKCPHPNAKMLQNFANYLYQLKAKKRLLAYYTWLLKSKSELEM